MIDLISDIVLWGIPLALILYGVFSFKRRNKVAGALVIVLGLAYWPIFEIARPNVETAIITKTEIIRVDEEGTNRDVRFIYTNGTEYRNEDDLLWLKRDSGRLDNKAEQAKTSGEEVLIVSDGLRFSWFSMYPNAVAINPGVLTYILIVAHVIALLIPYALIFGLGRLIGRQKTTA